jgi:tetratricopeptide (TPR) repeat protein
MGAPAGSAAAGTTGRRPVFISGTVAMDDGSPVPGSVDVEAVCSAQPRVVAHTSSQGDFAFEWNTAGSVSGDAGYDGRISAGSSAVPPVGGARGPDFLANCELRALAPGYTSGRAVLSDRDISDNFDVGTIVLHRLKAGEGHTVSMLALQAPKDAVKNFDKGTEQARANKLTDAAVSFQKALAKYPQYADAWFSLGKVESRMGASGLARTDFLKAIGLDAKMAGPWQQLGYMASDERNWEEAAKYLDEAVRLDPVDSAMAWYFSATADYNLRRFEAAERSVRAEIKLDRDQNPRAQYLLGLILIARQDLEGGADALRKYIQAHPDSADVESAKKQLSRIESQISQSVRQ